MTPPVIHDWHDPHALTCSQNIDPAFDCTCKRVRNRKPFKTVRVNDRNAPAGIEPEIIVEIHPSGVLVFREKGRRRRYETTAGRVFSGIVWRDAMAAAAAKKRARKKK